MSETTGAPPQPEDREAAAASPARVYDYWLGGKDHYAADRRVGAAVARVAPWVVAGARANRAFLIRAVTELAGRGIGQFVDLGSGLPTQQNVHQVVQQITPTARVVYVDHDPVVVAHGRALLATDPGTAAIAGDARDPGGILANPELARLIDLTEPVGVLMVALLHFLTDTEAAALVVAFRQVMTPGSLLVISHAATGEGDQAVAMSAAARVYQDGAGTVFPRTREQIAGLFAGFDLLPPGLVPVNAWRPTTRAGGRARAPMLGALGAISGRRQ